MAETVQANCNNCGGERNAFVQSHYSVGDYEKTPIGGGDYVQVGWDTTIEILECCGCKRLSVRRRRWFSEWDPQFEDEEISYWPPEQRDLPEWHSQLADDNLRKAMQEVYVAVGQSLLILAAIGVRTLLDRAFYLLLEEKDHGPFARKLEEMVKKGLLAESQRKIFQIIANVGNAATHQAHAPSQKTLIRILTAVETFLYQNFILPDEAEHIAKETPDKDKPTPLDVSGLSEAAPKLEVGISIQEGYIRFDGTPIGQVVGTSKGWHLDKTTADSYELDSDRIYKTHEEIIAVFRELAGRELLEMPRGPGAPST